MEKWSPRHEQLMQTGVTMVSYCFEDIYQCAPKLFQRAVDLMTDEELEKFIDENLSGWENGLISGLCTDQGVVLSTCAQESVDIPGVFGKKKLKDAEEGIFPCFSCEDKIPGKSGCLCDAEDYCVAICAYNDFVRAKDEAFKLIIEKDIYRAHLLGKCKCGSKGKCIAARYFEGEINPSEVVRLLSSDRETLNVTK